MIAQGTADELKAQVGGERLELTVSDRTQLESAAEVLSILASGHVVTEPQSRSLTAPVTGAPGGSPRPCGSWTSGVSGWTTSDCTGQPWTTCS